jgi:hypothetical protein
MITQLFSKKVKKEIIHAYTMGDILHYPQLDSVLMVERTIQKNKEYPTKMSLWKSLPKKMQYQTFKFILDYLEKSNKIMYDKNKIIWIFPNSKKLNDLLHNSVSA